MPFAMFSFTSKWPLGLNARTWPILAIGFVFGVVALGLIDEPIARAARTLPDTIHAVFNFITRAGRSDWILLPSLALTLGGLMVLWVFQLKNHRQRITQITARAGFVFLGVAIPGIIANLIKRSIGRARPLNLDELGVHHFEPFNNAWQFQSFPSGDATTIFGFAFVMAWLFPRLKAPLLILAILVSAARIIIGMHFPSDVFGGIVLGTLGAYAMRNFYAHRGWLFETTTAGTVVLKST